MAACILGGHRSWSGLRHLRGRRVCVSAEEAVPYQVDGDAVGHLPATFELGQRPQRFLVP
jgi:diacylglycerol kinase family enzyme